MTGDEWGTFGAFVLLLIGLSFFSPELAVGAGLIVGAAIIVQHPTFFLGRG